MPPSPSRADRAGLALVADASLVVRERIARHLEPRFRCVQFAAHVDVLSARMSADPGLDLLVLDLALPGERGIDVLRRISALRVRPAMIALSSRPSRDEEVESILAGAVAYLAKPIGASAFEAVLDECFPGAGESTSRKPADRR